MRRSWLAVLAVLALASCGGGDDSERPTVFAAASLTEVLEALEPDARFNFAGSDELATQIREGARADVYAAASPRYPAELREEGLVEEPQVFARNRLVIVVPADNPAAVSDLGDLARPGLKLVVGAEGVPIGDYTRTVLERARRTDVLANVVSREEDVKGVLGKVALGEADAGFVYATDARAAGDDVRSVELPAGVQADVEYPVAVVAGTPRRAAAEAFVERLLGADGREALREAGFELP
jgi:molybdate transport system substrate-binding protein